MCLLLLALNTVPQRPWLLLGNRDEFHARATAPAAAWNDRPDVFGGRDLVAGGSWLALHRSGRFAAVTNVRTLTAATAPRSRGDLVADFVKSDNAAENYVETIASQTLQFGPFNLIVGGANSTWGLSSIDSKPWRFESGVHALSNGSRHDEWPKMRRLRERFGAIVEDAKVENADNAAIDSRFLDLLTDTESAPDSDLPETGVGLAIERVLAPIFIRGTTYATRASTVAYCDESGDMTLIERRFGPDATALGETRIAIART